MSMSSVRWLAIVGLLCSLSPLAQSQSVDPLDNAKVSTVFVATYNDQGKFIGWGSGFFVDEGIVVTNKHVVYGGQSFKVFPIGSDGTVDLHCGKQVGLSDVKVNLNDDAGYIRAYLECPHGKLQFMDGDPAQGGAVSVLGFPARSTLAESLKLSTTTGSVTGTTPDGWLTTDAYLHFGNSGGPVISNGKVAGVAVAKSTDASGKYITGYFVPTTVVLRGLLYANDSTFGYTPQERQKNSSGTPAFPYGVADDPFNPLRLTKDATNGDCIQSLSDGGEATGFGGCRCKPSYHQNASRTACIVGQPDATQTVTQQSSSTSLPAQSSSSSSKSPETSQASSQSPVTPPPTLFQVRTCNRVTKWFPAGSKILDRLNQRLERVFGFRCGR